MEREEESITGIGEGIAIPHGKCDAVSKSGDCKKIFGIMGLGVKQVNLPSQLIFDTF